MKKEDLIKLGLDEAAATKVADASTEELKGYIPKHRFDEVNDANKQLKTESAERDKQLEELKKSAGAGDELKKQIEALQAENKAKAEAHDAQIKQMKVDAAVERALTGAKAKNSKAVKALLDLEKAELEGEDVKGLSDQIKKLTEAEDTKFLFGDSKPGMKGVKPGESGDGSGDGGTPSSLLDAVTMHLTNQK